MAELFGILLKSKYMIRQAYLAGITRGLCCAGAPSAAQDGVVSADHSGLCQCGDGLQCHGATEDGAEPTTSAAA